MAERSQVWFQRMAIITTIAVYILIIVGGSVRASGAGMGCPDWPKCFGQWIPPTDVSQLPADYQTIYKDRGYANVIFNPVKTWTEYFNRLTGATIGILVFITLILAWVRRRSDAAAFKASLAAFLLVGFNGWLGSVVVSSNLHPAMITTHMFAALLTVAVLIYATTRSWSRWHRPDSIPTRGLSFALAIALVLSLAQIAMGTQVREAVDVLALNPQFADRVTWFAALGQTVMTHVIFAGLVVVWNAGVIVLLWRWASRQKVLRRLIMALAGVILAQVAMGVSFALAGFPALLQPLHLLGAGLIFGLQIALLLVLQDARRAPVML
ncbi:MAG: COX15/CtaA family protein [Halothiobacillaceae bacterium]|nr:COX15/CtaA family protein [Halothiobacillaceae bacterium]